MNGTLIVTPPSFAAFSIAAAPASTIKSAIETCFPPVADVLNSFWIVSNASNTLDNCAGLFAAQYFWGAKRILAPLAPPLLSDPRNVEAEAQAAETNSETVKPEASTFAFKASISDVSTNL